MAKETKDFDVTINGETRKVTICAFPALKQIALGRRILNLVSPVLKSLNIDISKGLDVKDIFKSLDLNFDKLSEALMQSSETDKLENLIFDLFKETSIGELDLNKQENFDMIFCNEFKALITVIKYIMEMNFSSLFGNDGIG